MTESIATFSPRTLLNALRLWRVDGQDGKFLYVTAVDSAQEQACLYLEFEQTQPGRIGPPASHIVVFPQAKELMLRAFWLSMIHNIAPLLSLRRSRVIAVAYQLVRLMMGLDKQRVRLLLSDNVGL